MSLGDVTLQKMIGVSCFRLISAIDERFLSLGTLADLIIKRYGTSLLLYKDIRVDVLQGLRREEAEYLAVQLGGKAMSDVYSRILRPTYSQGTKELHILYCFFNLDEPEIEEKEPLPKNPVCPSLEYGLYDYQREVISKSLRHLCSGERRSLIHMPTGAGKTRSAMYLLARFFQDLTGPNVAIWLAHSEELCDQASDEFQKCWSKHGDHQLKLGRYYGEHDLDLGSFENGVIVAGLQKLYSRSLSQQGEFLKLKRRVKLVIMDEAHQAIAPTYQHLLNMLAPQSGQCSILGLSATPGRSSVYLDESEKLARFFSRNKVKISIGGFDDPFQYLQGNGYLAKPEFEFIDYDPKISLSQTELTRLADGFDISEKVISELAEHDQRNLLIASKVIKLTSDKKNKVIVFTASVGHAQALSDVLSIKGIRAASVSSLDAHSVRRRRIKLFKSDAPNSLQVLFNYGVLTTGFDAPKTNVAVIARPTQSVVLYSQMIGRAMRGERSGGNKTCKIITVVDNIPGFRNIYDGFTHWEEVW